MEQSKSCELNPFALSGTSPPEDVPSDLNEFGTLTPNASADIQSRHQDRDLSVSGRSNGGVPKTSGESAYSRPRLVTVKDLARLYRLSIGAVYSLIKTEPDFPYVNVGLKKKFLIDVAEFETWFADRTKKQKHAHFAIPSIFDLKKVFKINGGNK